MTLNVWGAVYVMYVALLSGLYCLIPNSPHISLLASSPKVTEYIRRVLREIFSTCAVLK